ncbi:MAG: hypothetical protein EXS15_05275 [Phycisphaerales bacterium]|nr:hypothetical protein [Phycisphaerales bacterium]
MKTLSTLALCSVALLLVGCDGGSSSTSDSRAKDAKPALAAPLADDNNTTIGVSSTTDAPGAAPKTPKKK